MCMPTLSVYKSDKQDEAARISFLFSPNACTVSRVPNSREWRQERPKVVPDSGKRVIIAPARPAPSSPEAKESKKGYTRDVSASAALDSTSEKGSDACSDHVSKADKQPVRSETAKAPPTDDKTPPAEAQPARTSSSKNDKADTTGKKKQRKESQKEITVEVEHHREEAKVSEPTTPPSAKPRSVIKPPLSRHQPDETRVSRAATPPSAKLRSAIKSPLSAKSSVRKRVRFQADDMEWTEWSDDSSCDSYTDPQLPEPSIDDILSYYPLPGLFSPSRSKGTAAHTVHNIDRNSRASDSPKALYRLREREERLHSIGCSTKYGDDEAKSDKERSRTQYADDPYPSRQWDLDSEIESAVDVGDESLVSLSSSRTGFLNEKPPLSRISSSDAFDDTISGALDMSEIAQRVAKKYPSMLDLEPGTKEPLVVIKPNEKIFINGMEPVFVLRRNSKIGSGKSWLLPEEVHSQKPQPSYKTSWISTPASSTLDVTQQDWSSSAMRTMRQKAQHSPLEAPAPAIREQAARKAPSLRSVRGSVHHVKTAEDIAREQGWTPHKTRSRASGYKPPTIQDVPEELVEQAGDRW